MRDIVWRVGLTLAALALLSILGLNVSCGAANQLLEQALGQTPQALIARYLTAIAAGDRQSALASWSPPEMPNAALLARRQATTDELLAYGPRLEYRVLDVVWWRTCCEPGVIDDADEAGGARVRIALTGRDRPEKVYVFDLLVPGGYWGAAAGYPVREWAIVDLYPEEAGPLAWPWRQQDD